MKKGIFILQLLIILSGCTKTVYVKQVEYLYPEDSWLMAIPYATPPNRVDFEKATIEARMRMLGEVYMTQTTNLQKCNIRLETISEWKKSSAPK